MAIPNLPPAPGVLPPFVGATSTERANRAPYRGTVLEVAERFGTSRKRAEILRGLLGFRRELRTLPFTIHRQWLAGSYVEALNREPSDVDVVTFYSITAADVARLRADASLQKSASDLFNATNVKAQFLCDAYVINMSASPTSIVDDTHYWYGLFSHQRLSYRWKGIVQVDMADASDDASAEAPHRIEGVLVGTQEQRAFLEAELQGAQDLLDRFANDEMRFLDRINVESRIEHIRRALTELETRQGRTAEVSLYFYGDPVVEQLGIDARFSAEALKAFQDLVSKQLASQLGPLGTSGPIRQESESRLHITDVVRGSFGFSLEEIATAPPLLGATSLATAVEGVKNLVQAAKQDDESFADAVGSSNARVYEALRSFLSIVNKAGATFAMAVPGETIMVDASSLAAAVGRAEAERSEVDDEPLDGVFLGVLLDSRLFEFRFDSGEVVRGKLERDVDPSSLLQYTGERCVGHFRVIVLKKQGTEIRRYTLLRVEV